MEAEKNSSKENGFHGENGVSSSSQQQSNSQQQQQQQTPHEVIFQMPGNIPMVDVTDPHDNDVLCGRGGAALRHPGNQQYRRLVQINKGNYITCLKAEKLKISRSIVAAIREQNGRFLEKDSDRGTYFDIGDRKAMEKTSQALREGQPKLRQRIVELGGGSVGAAALLESQFPGGNMYNLGSPPQHPDIVIPPRPEVTGSGGGGGRNDGGNGRNNGSSGQLQLQQQQQVVVAQLMAEQQQQQQQDMAALMEQQQQIMERGGRPSLTKDGSGTLSQDQLLQQLGSATVSVVGGMSRASSARSDLSAELLYKLSLQDVSLPGGGDSADSQAQKCAAVMAQQQQQQIQQQHLAQQQQLIQQRLRPSLTPSSVDLAVGAGTVASNPSLMSNFSSYGMAESALSLERAAQQQQQQQQQHQVQPHRNSSIRSSITMSAQLNTTPNMSLATFPSQQNLMTGSQGGSGSVFVAVNGGPGINGVGNDDSNSTLTHQNSRILLTIPAPLKNGTPGVGINGIGSNNNDYGGGIEGVDSFDASSGLVMMPPPESRSPKFDRRKYFAGTKFVRPPSMGHAASVASSLSGSINAASRQFDNSSLNSHNNNAHNGMGTTSSLMSNKSFGDGMPDVHSISGSGGGGGWNNGSSRSFVSNMSASIGAAAAYYHDGDQGEVNQSQKSSSLSADLLPQSRQPSFNSAGVVVPQHGFDPMQALQPQHSSSSRSGGGGGGVGTVGVGGGGGGTAGAPGGSLMTLATFHEGGDGDGESHRSMMSGCETIFSDLSRKIGNVSSNVSTRSLAMSDISNMEDHDEENDDGDGGGRSTRRSSAVLTPRSTTPTQPLSEPTTPLETGSGGGAGGGFLNNDDDDDDGNKDEQEYEA